MSKLKSRNLSKNILVIERTDKESPTTISKDNNERFKLLKNSIKKIIPRKYYKKLIWSFIILLRPVKKRKMQKIWGSSDFSRWAVSEVVRRNPILRDTDVKFLDVSNHKVVSFKEFEEEMISASAIVTTRLHGAILGAMLGKDTYFVKGVWHKYIGVYEHSLKEYSNVNLIEYK